MNTFRLNLGVLFSHPFESEYAVWRRCLVANPGVAISAIENSLRISTANSRSFFNQLNTFNAEPYDYNLEHTFAKYSYRRQCPECALNLYHSDIFGLDWLTHCPLHHCLLTTTCPVCHQRWPDRGLLSRRKCPVCGRVSLRQIVENKSLSSPILNYQLIGDIFKFIHSCDHPHTELHSKDSGWTFFAESKWWHTVLVSSLLFPSFHVHNQSEFTVDQLRSLHIDVHPLRHKATPLKLLDRGSSFLHFKKIQRPRKTDTYPNTDWAAHELLMADYKAMRRIVAWIIRQTPCNHEIYINSYRHIERNHLAYTPNPCPYCLALSLWFFHTAAEKYENMDIRKVNNYPFWHYMAYHNFYDHYQFYCFLSQDRSFGAGRRFSAWLHIRSLEISFLSLLRYAIKFTSELDRIRWHGGDVDPWSQYQTMPLPDQYIHPFIKDNRLYFYYKNEHPLEGYNLPALPNITDKCREFRKVLPKIQLDGSKYLAQLDGRIPNSGFTYKKFLSLHRWYWSYIQDLMRSY